MMIWFDKITINKVVEEIKKLGFERVSNSDTSSYYRHKRIEGVKIRVSNHLPTNNRDSQINIVVSNRTCIVGIYKSNTYGFTSFKKFTKYINLLISVFKWYNSNLIKAQTRFSTELDMKVKELSEANNIKLKNIKKELNNLLEVNKRYKNEITNKENKLRKQKEDIDEIVNLLENLKEQELGSLIKEINGTCKTYKLNHFPKDVQDFILDLIKEYYNTLSLCPSG